MTDSPNTTANRTVSRVRARVWPDADLDARRFTVGVAIAMAIGFVIRVAFVLVKQSQLTLTTGDAFWYHFQAKLVAEGRGFLNPFLFYKQDQVGPGADHPPGFVLILTVLEWLGISSPQGQRLVMSAVGTVSILVIALLARRLGGVNVGIVAAALAALYPNIWINDGMLMVETVYILSIALSLLFAYRYLERPSRVDVLIVSISLMIAAMHRPEALVLFIVFLTPMVLWRRGLSWRERFTQLVMAALVPIIAFAPWVAYNMSRYEEPVTVSTGAGQTLAATNCIWTYEGEALAYYDFRCLTAPTFVQPTGVPSQTDAEYRRIAFEFMNERRSELPKIMVLRVARLWHLYRVEQSLNLDGWVEGRAGGEPSGDKRLVEAALYSYFALLPLAIAGAAVLVRRKITLWPLLVQPLLATATAAMTFGITRYRAGAEITMVVLAAVALCWMADRIVDRRREPDPAPAATADV